MATSLATAAYLHGILLAFTPASFAECDDPLPIDPAVITQEMGLESFSGANQTGPVCGLNWEGGSGVTLMIYGPKALADLGLKFTSPKQAAEKYAGESPKGVEAMPGAPNAYMVFDPKTPSRRVFVESNKNVYMIVMSQNPVPLAILAKALVK